MMMRLVRPILVGVALLCMSASLAAKSTAADGGYYTARDKEFYLTADEIFFIRPGLELEILGIEIPDDMQPLVTFSLKDPGGLPLDINGVSTPGDVDVRYMLTYIPQGEEFKVSYHDRLRDRNGTLTALGDGVYTYKFTTILPDTYDPDATHTLALVGRRDLREFDLDRYVANTVHHFVPSGMSEPDPREVVTTATCNGRCHDPVTNHGGRYREIQVCSQCHNPGLVDEDDGLSYDLGVAVHRLHAGLEPGEEVHYPAEINDCELCHTGGTPTEAFPLVANPNPVPVCDGSINGTTEVSWGDTGAVVDVHVHSPDGPVMASSGGAGSQETGKWVNEDTALFLVNRGTGETLGSVNMNTTVLGCVGNAPGTFRGEAAKDHTNWLDHPSRLFCGACHANVNFETGEGHPGGDQANDNACGFCHQPDTGNEYDASVRGAHLPIYKSTQLPGVLFEFKEVMNTAPGQQPVVMFDIRSKFGPLNPGVLDRLRFTITGPNEDFSFYAREDVVDQGDGINLAVKVGDYWAYEFDTAIPEDAEGSYTVSVEGRNEVPVERHGEVDDERDVIQASLLEFAVTDDVATPRRIVVEDYNCESCHGNLALHGGGRTNAQYCNTCHKPDAVDRFDLGGNESIHFKYMIHKIHRGHDLENGYVVVRSRGIFDFSEVHFSGDLRNCEKCHVDDSYKLPLPDGLAATVTPAGWWSPTLPQAATCLSCHDGDDAAAHAFSNTVTFGEACGACHGDGKTYSVERLHAR